MFFVCLWLTKKHQKKTTKENRKKAPTLLFFYFHHFFSPFINNDYLPPPPLCFLVVPRTIHNINHTRLVRKHIETLIQQKLQLFRNQHHIPELTMSVQIVPNGSGKDEELAKYENNVGGVRHLKFYARVTSNQVQVIDKTQYCGFRLHP